MEEIEILIINLRAAIGKKEAEMLETDISSYAISNIVNRKRDIDSFEDYYLSIKMNFADKPSILTNFRGVATQIQEEIDKIKN